MGRLDRFTEFFGSTADQRYHSNEGPKMPDEVSDPHEWQDESKIKRREWLARNKRTLVAVSFLGIVVMGILSFWARTFIPQIIHNTYFQVGVYHLVLITVVSVLSIRSYRDKMTRFDWLVLAYGDRTQVYLGYYNTTEEGDPCFVPTKGFSMLGYRSDVLTLGDMSSEMARQFSKTDRKADDPAKIRLHPSMTASAETFLGTITVQLTDGLEPDEFGRETDIEATVPDLADKKQMNDLKVELEEQVKENGYLKDQVSMLRDQQQSYKEMATSRIDELRDRQIDHVERIVHAVQGTSGGMGMGGVGGTDPMMESEPDYGSMEEEVDEELEDDF